MLNTGPPVYTGAQMLVFAHTGITLGLFWLCDSLGARRAADAESGDVGDQSSAAVVYSGLPQVSQEAHTDSISLPRPNPIDYRLVLLGSMLPDIIDKPVGVILLGNGRIFGHTLLFALGLLVAGGLLYSQRHKAWLLILGYGCAIHLVLDRMWQTPATLLWPLYGWTFERGDGTGWLPRVFHSLTHDIAIYLPEIVGALILIAFAVRLVQRDRVKSFIFRGNIGP